MTLVEATPININPRNVVGTVLALNGFRRYFNIFHAKLPTCAPPTRLRKRCPTATTLPGDLEAGGHGSGTSSPLNDDSNASDSSDSEATSTTPFIKGTEVVPFETASADGKEPPTTAADLLMTDEMLAGLPKWLDKLFDGSKSVTRHYIPEWPEGLRSAGGRKY